MVTVTSPLGRVASLTEYCADPPSTAAQPVLGLDHYRGSVVI